MVSLARWKPETKEALRAWIMEYMREHQKVLSRDLLTAVRRDRRFYRLSSLNTFKLGFIMKGLPVDRVGTTKEGAYEYRIDNDAVIVQEWIPGSGEAQFSYAGLWDRGEPIASLVARRTRQHPIDFGRSSTFVETIEQDRVEQLAGRFLKSLDYTGVVELEFKHDRRDGQYKLLDVNGRFWTWNGLGALAGVDFPYLAWRQAVGQTVAPARARTGVAWMHGSRDIVAAYQELSRGAMTVRDYLAGLRKPLAFANFALDDPLPAIVEIPVAVWNRIANGGKVRANTVRAKECAAGLPTSGPSQS